MRRLGIASLLVATAWAAWATPPVAAQGPLQRMNLFKRVSANPEADYMLNESHGPWLIMAATFSGDGAEAQARELILEIRNTLKLEAYLHRITFDHTSESLVGLGVDRYGKPKRMKYLNDYNEQSQQFAVLVGNYPSLEDATAQRDLERVKLADPKALNIVELAKQNRKTYQQLIGLRLSQKVADTQKLQDRLAQMYKGDGKIMIRNNTRNYGPMGSAFLTRNPLLPDNDLPAHLIDSFVYEMNRPVKHSLLECKGKYSVKVATFTGTVIVNQKQIREIEKQGSFSSRLAEAALRAHELCEALRLKGYEAYEFHDRCASIVTVGSFDTLGTQLPDGKIDLNPKIHEVIKEFSVDPIKGGQPKSLIGIPFDVQAIPVVVPRRSVAADYARN
jgi:hypothetical protein